MPYDINPRTFPPVRSASSCESSQRPPGLEHLLIEGVQIPFPVFLHPQTRPGCQIRIGSLSLSSTVRSWHMMTYVPCCLALHHQGANKLAGCCLQLWVSPKTWRAHGCFYGFYSFRSQPCWQPCWQCSCFPGPKIHSFFRQKIHLHARGPHHLFPDEFHQISSPMLCSPVHRGEAVIIPHLRAVRRSSCITHSSVASETPSFRYLWLTNWIEATSMLKATAFQATYQSFLEASCKNKPPQETIRLRQMELRIRTQVHRGDPRPSYGSAPGWVPPEASPSCRKASWSPAPQRATIGSSAWEKTMVASPVSERWGETTHGIMVKC